MIVKTVKPLHCKVEIDNHFIFIFLKDDILLKIPLDEEIEQTIIKQTKNKENFVCETELIDVPF